MPFNNLQSANYKDLFGALNLDRWGDAPTMSMVNQKFAPAMGNIVMKRLSNAPGYEDSRHRALSEFMTAMDPKNIDSNAERIRSRGIAGATAAAPQTAHTMKSLGYDTGATGGAITAGYDSAHRSANNYRSHMYSPEGRSQALRQLLAALNEGLDMGPMDDFLKLNDAAHGREMMRHQTGTAGGRGGMLGQVLGSLAGMYLNSQIPGAGTLFSGMGGGGLNASGASGSNLVAPIRWGR